MLVFSLAALLVGGMVLLVGLVFSKTNSDCEPKAVNLPTGDHVVNVVPSGNVVQVVTLNEQGVMQVLNVDACSGDVTSKLQILATKP